MPAVQLAAASFGHIRENSAMKLLTCVWMPDCIMSLNIGSYMYVT